MAAQGDLRRHPGPPRPAGPVPRRRDQVAPLDDGLGERQEDRQARRCSSRTSASTRSSSSPSRVSLRTARPEPGRVDRRGRAGLEADRQRQAARQAAGRSIDADQRRAACPARRRLGTSSPSDDATESSSSSSPSDAELARHRVAVDTASPSDDAAEASTRPGRPRLRRPLRVTEPSPQRPRARAGLAAQAPAGRGLRRRAPRDHLRRARPGRAVGSRPSRPRRRLAPRAGAAAPRVTLAGRLRRCGGVLRPDWAASRSRISSSSAMSAGRARLRAREEALLRLGVGHHDEEVDDGRHDHERDHGVQERAEASSGVVAEDVRRPSPADQAGQPARRTR